MSFEIEIKAHVYNRNFVIENKSSHVQAKNIINFILSNNE